MHPLKEELMRFCVGIIAPPPFYEEWKQEQRARVLREKRHAITKTYAYSYGTPEQREHLLATVVVADHELPVLDK